VLRQQEVQTIRRYSSCQRELHRQSFNGAQSLESILPMASVPAEPPASSAIPDDPGGPGMTARPSRFGAPGEALRSPSYRVLLATQLAIGLTQPLLFFSQSWWVNTAVSESNRVLFLGLLGASRGIVFLAYVTLGGAIADRMPRRKVVQYSSVLTVALIIAVDALLWLPVLGETESIPLVLLMIGLFATFGLATAQDVPTRTSMVRDTLPDAQLGGGIALFQLLMGGSAMFAAPTAGILIERLGIPATYVLGGIGPLLVAILVWWLPRDVGAADPDSAKVSVLANLRGGFGVLREDPVVRWTVILTWVSTMLGLSILGVLVAAWASEVLGLNAAGWGRLAFFWGLGSLVAATALTIKDVTRHRGMFFLGWAFIFGLAVLAFSLSRSLPLVYASTAVAGGSYMAFTIAGISIVQRTVPNRLLGRVTGLLLLGQGLMQVFALFVGIVARFAGLEAVYLAAAIVLISLTTAVAVTQRPLRTLD
jgi:MFS family permease